MLGRKTYTQEELDHARAAVAAQLAAYAELARATEATGDPAARAALDAFEPLFSNNMALVLDRYFVHRVRLVAGKDGNPLNEVELIADSLLNNDAVLRGNNVITLVPEQTVLQLEPGDRIALSASDLGRLADAFLAEVEARFAPAADVRA